jgi:hypothetical protein
MFIEAGLAQSVERRTLNPVVVGSSPTVGASFLPIVFYYQNILKKVRDFSTRSQTTKLSRPVRLVVGIFATTE